MTDTTTPRSRDRVQDVLTSCPIVCAPMVQGSELAFRMLVRSSGVRLCYSPMLTAARLVRDPPDPRELQVLRECALPEDRPLVVQLAGDQPGTLVLAARAVLNAAPDVTALDLNLGCPQTCADRGNFGAFLLERDPEQACACVRALCAAVSVPIWCKIRLLRCGSRASSGAGDTDSKADEALTVRYGRALVAAGASLICVHARRRPLVTNARGSSGARGRNCSRSRTSPARRRAREQTPSDRDFAIVAALAAALGPRVPVIINGGITSVTHARVLMKQTGAAAAMVGTALLLNPLLAASEQHPRDAGASRPADLADAYLDMCARFPPPSAMYIRRHLRWIFRSELEPEPGSLLPVRGSYPWRAKMWTFLARPQLETLHQFREVVRLFRHLEAGGVDGGHGEGIGDDTPSFKRCRARERDARGCGAAAKATGEGASSNSARCAKRARASE